MGVTHPTAQVVTMRTRESLIHCLPRHLPFLLVSLVALQHASCGKKEERRAPVAEQAPFIPDPGGLRGEPAAGGQAEGLVIRLEPGQSPDALGARAELAKGTPLTDGELKTLLARVPAVAAKDSDVKSFAFRARSLPPPRTGETVTTVFPPPPRPRPADPEEEGPLKVLRVAPEGEVSMAPRLSVTFSQPMVAVTSHADTVAKGVPVRLSPELPGTWRWIGTRTLLFETESRFPMATTFTAEVAEGLRSVTGGTLTEGKSWTFSTPPVRLLHSFPTGGPHRLDPMFFLQFDQKIDPERVLATVRLEGGGQPVSLRRVSDEELAKGEETKGLMAALKDDRFGPRHLVFVATSALLPGTGYTVSVGPGTPSAEGPRTTTSPQTFTFRTYDPFKVEWTSCTAEGPCRPPQGFSLRFNNPIDVEAFDPKSVVVTPLIPDMQVVARGSFLSFHGRTRGMTTYTVTLPAGLKDAFGQTLGAKEQRTFVFVEAHPQIHSQYGPMTVLDPSGDRSFRVFSVNHRQLRVTVWKVQPSDWPTWQSYQQRIRWSREEPKPPGTIWKEWTVDVKGETDALTETAIPLGGALNKAGHGQLAVQVTQWPLPGDRSKRQFALGWIQATDLAVDAFADHGRLLAWVTRLKDGAPVKGARVELVGQPGIASAESGLAKLSLPGEDSQTRRILVARTQDDLVMLPESLHAWGRSQWTKKAPPGEQLRWFVFDDRKLYKPKEEVRLKGFVRVVNMGSEGGVRLLPDGTNIVSFTVFDPRRNKIGGGTAPVDALGGFDFSFTVPDQANLGNAQIRMVLGGPMSGSASHSFQIQEFKRPEFEVGARASSGPHVVGGHADVEVNASYFAGGGLPGALVHWEVRTSQAQFTPPNRSDFTFVGWERSWRRDVLEARTAYLTHDGVTDGRGADRLRIHFDRVDPARPWTVQAAATITDVNRRTWTANQSLLVHPSRLYVGLATEKAFVHKGTPLKVKVIVTDLEGKAVPEQIVSVEAVRQVYRYQKRTWEKQDADPQSCRVTSTMEPVVCTFETREGGEYVLSARVTDSDGRPNRTMMNRWVSGGELPPVAKVEKEKVILVADKTEYAPGDSAELLVLAPFYPAEGLMTVRRAGILMEQRFSMKEPTAVLRLPLTDAHYPSLSLQVDLVGSAPRIDARGEPDLKLPRRPAYASGSTSLAVPPRQRSLEVEVAPRVRKLLPGGSTVIDVYLKDSAGQGVAGGGVALVAVDEAVLALTGYKLSSPLSSFYPHRMLGVQDRYLREHVQLVDPKKLSEKLDEEEKSAEGSPVLRQASAMSAGDDGVMDSAPPPSPTMGAGGMKASRRPGAVRPKRQSDTPESVEAPGQGEAGPAIRVRRDFTPLAVFAPAVRTDSAGRAQVPLKLPDSLTRYRVMAVAVSGATHYGYGESSVTAQQPLMLRPQPPRFLNFGDRFELPVVLQNPSDRDMTVAVGVRGSNVEWTGPQGQRIQVPANDRREVRFAARSVQPGTARFQVAAASGNWADAAERELPVWTPATTEAFATYGHMDQGAAMQPVAMPKGVFREFGGLEVSTSSTALQALTDAVIYLHSYPFECSEQVASRVLSIAALRDVLSAFKASGLPSKERIEAGVSRDLQRLQNMQNDDGGWGFWRRFQTSWPFLSIHVTHALLRAKGKGFAVPEQMLSRALGHIRQIERFIPSDYGEWIRRVIIAYSLYVRRVGGDADVAKAKTIYAELRAVKEPPLEAIAWLYPVFVGAETAKGEIGEIRRELSNRVTETAGAAHFQTSYSDGGHLILHSDRRVDGLLLETLIADQPKSDLIPKIVRGLLAHRTRGRWANTQETVWVLLALDRYFNTYESVTPNFVSRLWLGEKFAGEHRFAGRTTEQHQVSIPMALLGEPGATQNLVLDKQGPGRLYYRIGMRYAPTDLRPPPANHGFTVQRRYEGVDDAKDVTLGPDGTWQVRAGARVAVVLTMAARARRYHVALVDPLPAGLEPVNASLLGAQAPPPPAAPGVVPRGRPGRRPGLAPLRHGGPGLMSAPRRHWGLWRAAWYEHQNLRDERAEAFASFLPAGVYTYRYTTQAITPGEFVVPPPYAEEMYHPETFGRGAGDRLIVR